MKEQPSQGRTLTERAAAGAAWALTGRGLCQVVGLGLSLLLLRLLEPKDYGLVGMVTAFIYILADVRDLRFSDALIQRKEVFESHLRSVFCLQAGVGLLFSVVLVISAPLIARFYQKPALLLITVALGLKPFLDSLADVSRALLVRRMEFRKIALADIVSLAVSGTLAVLLAFKGYGVWALVSLNLGVSAITSGIVIAAAGWLPIPGVHPGRLRELWRFSTYLYGARLLAQFSRNGDKVLIGWSLGDVALGMYGLGFRLMMIPLEQVAWVIGRVMFAALSEIRDDLERFRNAYLRSVRLLSLITFPITAGLCVTVSELIHAIARPEWSGAIMIIRIFCVIGFIESIGTTAGWIFFSRGRTGRQFAWMFVVLAATIAAVAIGLPYGIEGVAVAYLVRTVLLVIPELAIAFRLVGLRVRTLLNWLAPTAIATGIMALAVLSLGAVLSVYFTLSAWAMLIAKVACGVLVYVACIWAGASELWDEVFELLRGFLQKGKVAA